MHGHNNFNADASVSSESRRLRYFEFIISEANSKITKEQGKLVFVKTVFELEAYLQKNQDQHRIGFIVEKPDCIKSTTMTDTDTHVSPIYFERTKTSETFVQFDSALGQFFLLPDTDGLPRRLFYSPHLRQANRQGCFEDAVIVLMKLLRAQGIIPYCEKNFADNRKALTLPLTKADANEHSEMEKLSSTTGLPYYMVAKFANISRRLEYQKQMGLLQEKGLKPILSIYTLTGIPKILIPNIERFDTMRNIRVRETEQFSKKLISGLTLLEFILKHGVIRNQTISKSDLALNLSNSAPLYDFGGRDFSAQREEFRASQAARSKNVFRLFYKKTASIRIANRIAEFASGMRPE